MKQDQSKSFFSFVFLHDKPYLIIFSHIPPNQGGKFTGFGNPQCKANLSPFIYIYILVDNLFFFLYLF